MWNWIKSLLFKKVVYGVIEEPKRNWLGFMLVNIDETCMGLTIYINGNIIGIGINGTMKKWSMPFNIAFKDELKLFNIDLFESGCMWYSKGHDIPFCYTMFWKCLQLENEFLIGMKSKFSILNVPNMLRAEYTTEYEIKGKIILLDKDLVETEYDMTMVCSNTIWKRGSSIFTKFLMSLFSNDKVITKLRINLDNGTSNIIGINTDKEIDLPEMLFEVVDNNKDLIKKIYNDSFTIEVHENSIYAVYG